MDLRDYDPAIARWLNIDPVTHHGQSTYNAFDANPVSIADPSGADGMVYGMAGQSAWSNPFPRGHATFGNGVGMNIARQRGNYDGNTFARNSLVFWGSERALYEQSWEAHDPNRAQTTTDPDEIFSILSYYSRQSKGHTITWWGTDTNGQYEVGYEKHRTRGGSDRISRSMWGKTYSNLRDYMSANQTSLRTKFNNMEIAGGTAEITGLLLAPFTEGASMVEAANGAIVSATGTFGNIAMDIMVDKKPGVAFGRFAQYILFKGMGGLANKIPGNYSKLVSATTTFMDAYLMPIFQDNYNKAQP